MNIKRPTLNFLRYYNFPLFGKRPKFSQTLLRLSGVDDSSSNDTAMRDLEREKNSESERKRERVRGNG